MDCRTQLHPYNRRGVPLFDAAFLQRWGNRKWEPNDADRAAAASLHIEVASRITTQHLGWRSPSSISATPATSRPRPRAGTASNWRS